MAERIKPILITPTIYPIHVTAVLISLSHNKLECEIETVSRGLEKENQNDTTNNLKDPMIQKTPLNLFRLMAALDVHHRTNQNPLVKTFIM